MEPTLVKKIGSVDPDEQNLVLRFQIDKILQKNEKEMLCRILDDTGIATALFNQRIDKLQVKQQYTMHNLCAKVVDNHIRIQMMPKCIIEHQQKSLSYKQKANDISKKFYALAEDVEKIKTIKQKINKNQEKNQNKDKKIEDDKPKKQSKTLEKAKFREKSPKTKFVEKNADKPTEKKKQQVTLKRAVQIPDNYITISVWVSKQRKNVGKAVWRTMVADSTGSLTAQFDNKTQLQGNKWYQFDNILVQALKNGEIILKQTDLTECKALINKQKLSYDKQPIKY